MNSNLIDSIISQEQLVYNPILLSINFILKVLSELPLLLRFLNSYKSYYHDARLLVYLSKFL